MDTLGIGSMQELWIKVSPIIFRPSKYQIELSNTYIVYHL